ncbi:hypothetical protein CPB85DRAFT_1436707 [Mucidula mucida]|nr:hypothetical protein CPB85DRAFT_1436707 [Mucidula mucida]
MPDQPPDYRTKLNNWCAQAGKVITYNDVPSGPQHSQTWSSTVYVDNVATGAGVGPAKGAAREMAAHSALLAFGVPVKQSV